MLCLLTQIALGTLSAFRASVSFLSNHDIYSSLGPGSCLSLICLPGSCFLKPELASILRKKTPMAFPVQPTCSGKVPSQTWNLMLWAPLSDWLPYPLLGRDGDRGAASSKRLVHLKHLLRSQFSFSYPSRALPSYRHLRSYL